MSDLRAYYDESYPPSIYAPPVPPPVPPTGATAGTPGTWTPANATPPANLTAIRGLGALGQTTAWTEGQYLVLGDNSHTYWNATTWNVGNAPAPPPEEPEE